MNISFSADSISNYCYVTCSLIHSNSCDPSLINPLPPQTFDELEPPDNIENKDALINNWICTGVFQETITHKCAREGKWIAKFNPCLPILSVQIILHNNRISALCDTGASRSLISSHLFNAIFSCNILPRSQINHNIKLVDVNNKLLQIMDSKDLTFTINAIKFTHNFIIFNSQRNQLLLGIDFFRKHNIVVHPNKGLAYESQDEQYISSVSLPKYDVYLKNDVTLLQGGQQVATFFLKMSVNDLQALSIIDNFLLFSSELIEPDCTFSELSIIHQYVRINSYLEFNAIITNQSADIKHFPKNEVIGQLEHVTVINNLQSIFDDDLSLCLMVYMAQVDEESLHINEERLFNDLSSLKDLQLRDINCSSDNHQDLIWLQDLHRNNAQMFSSHDWSVGDKSGSSIPITVRTNATVCRQKTNKINPKIKDRADEIISTLLQRKLIQISKSPWNSRVLFVEKQPENVHISKGKVAGQKENPNIQRKLRLVVDYRFINSRIKDINTSWPAPTVFEMLNTLHSARFISTMDITQGFFHFRLSENARKYTAFSWNSTVYEFLRLPQGLRISSAIMQSKMCQFVRKYGLLGTEVYIDNLIVHATTKQEYKHRLESLFSACVKSGIKCKTRKCFHFITDQFILFGFKIDLRNHSIQPEMDKIQAICDLVPPTSKKLAKSFIGSINYFCPLIPDLQQILSPIHEASAPNRKAFAWTDECQTSFEKVKALLAKIPMIYLINPSLPFYASTDALAGISVAYALWQHHTGLEQLVPVKFNSHKLSQSEKNLSQYETEGLALVHCLSKEQEILSFGNLILYTDCRSLTFINRYASSCSKLSRWDIFVRSFNMTIHFLPNTDGRIKIVDLLTRNNIHKAQFKNKLSKSDLDKFQQFNFDGMPDMQINDVMKLIQTLNDLVDKQVLSQKIISNVQQHFFSLPTHTFSNNNHCIVRPQFSPNVLLVTNMEFSEDKISVPATPSLALSEINWDAPELCSIQIKELLANYLNNISILNIINFQKQEKWIQNAAQRSNFFYTEGLLFRATQLSNGVKVSQLVLPDKLAFNLIKDFHQRPFVLHTSVNKMQRHLAQIFYIRNFNLVAKQVIDSCQFCLLNKPFPAKNIPPGQKIVIERPGQAISIDICSVRSGSEIDAFLCIVDNFSKFICLVPISRNCSSQDIVTALMKFWVQSQGFPLALTSDGASNMISKLMGETASIMNIRLYRISPGNSKSNLAERYNLLAIQALRIFDQSYTISDQNFPIILSMVANMLNYMPNPSGYSPYYLQFGRKPRLHPFVNFRNLDISQNLDNHVKSLLQAQNVCYILFKISQDVKETNTHKHSFKVGDFCLLRKLQISGPKHGAKLKPIFYSEPFRIVRLYKTNVMLVPFNRQIMKKRIKGEGSITRNMATIAKYNRLKPLRNPNALLHLSVNEKILRKFNTILQTPIVKSDILEPVPGPPQGAPTLFKAANPLVRYGVHDPKPLQVQNKNEAPTVADICPIFMQPIRPGETSASICSQKSQDDTVSIQSSYFWKVVPKNKIQRHMLSSTVDSTSIESNLNGKQETCYDSSEQSVSSYNSVFEVPIPPIYSPEQEELSSSSDNLNDNSSSSDNSNSSDTENPKAVSVTCPAENQQIRDFATITPRTTRTQSNRSLQSRISLSSGKSLVLQLNPSSDSVKDVQK